MLKTEEIQLSQTPEYSIIWLHGLGASGHDFVDIVPQLSLNNYPIRFVFPHAPQRAVTINAGFIMPAWYDIISLHRDGDEDLEGLLQAEIWIQDLIKREMERGIDSERILLAGFSQGGALALFTALRSPIPLMGVMVLSAYLPAGVTLEDSLSENNRESPIMLAHGDQDDVVMFHYARIARQWLCNHGYKVSWHEYPRMGHSVCMDEINDISLFLKSLMD